MKTIKEFMKEWAKEVCSHEFDELIRQMEKLFISKEDVLGLIDEEIEGYKIFVGDKNFKQFTTKKVIKVLEELKARIKG